MVWRQAAQVSSFPVHPDPLTCRWIAFFAAYRSVERVYQGLDLDELRPCSLGLVPIEGSGKHLCMRIPIFNHSISRFLQHFKPFAHLGHFQPLPNTLLRDGRLVYLPDKDAFAIENIAAHGRPFRVAP